VSILVTGGGGFVGRQLCGALSRRGDQVIALCRPGSGIEISGVTCRECDLADAELKELLSGLDDIHTIVHLAQSNRFREFPAGARDMFDVNLRATFQLLEFSRLSGVNRFIYASSGGIYGRGSESFSDQAPVTVKDSLGFYLSTKLAAEILVGNYSPLFSTATLRVFFAYGPTQQRDRLIPRLMDNVINGRPITLEGDSGLAINPIFIDDMIEILLRVIDAKAAMKLNVAGAQAITLRDMGLELGKIVGRAPKFIVQSADRSPMLVGDTSGLYENLKFRPSVDFPEGARRLFQHFKVAQ
jgi:UDP-glucose 4-epimerase